MVTPPDIEAQILRFYQAEKWTVGTIARQLHIHHSVVRRVLAQAGLPRIGPPSRPSMIDAYLPFIRQTLESFPTLTASRLYVMAYERGYRGSPDHFRHLIACHRPRQKAEAYLRLRCLPGEQAQVDWGHFGHLEIGDHTFLHRPSRDDIPGRATEHFLRLGSDGQHFFAFLFNRDDGGLIQNDPLPVNIHERGGGA